jgi:hypothetical protein
MYIYELARNITVTGGLLQTINRENVANEQGEDDYRQIYRYSE